MGSIFYTYALKRTTIGSVFRYVMILNSDFILPHFKEKMRQGSRDTSRHVLCHDCKARTKLYTLKDGRKKCSVCNKKFEPRKKTDNTKLQQYADILLCFTLDFSAHRASQISKIRYRLVSDIYNNIRYLLTEQNLVPGKIRLMMATEPAYRGIHGSEYCKRCGNSYSCKGRQQGDAPVFGVRALKNGKVFLESLQDEPDEASKAPQAFSGFICNGTFHRFTNNRKQQDGMESFWSWVEERLRKYHGVNPENMGLYLKELEWKYNHRLLGPDVQAVKIAAIFPEDFLETWSK